MIASKKLRMRASTIIIVVSAMMWGLLLFDTGGLSLTHCIVSSPNTSHTGVEGIPLCSSASTAANTGSSPASFQTLLAMNPIPSLMLGWAIMMVAMMLPVLIPTIHYILGTSLRRKRLSSTMLFLTGYFSMWMLAGVVIVALTFLINLLLPASPLPVAIFGIIVLVWESSPAKQRSLNRNHRHRALAAFGWEANRDALRFGFEHGAWCIASCWALMWLPMLLPTGHNLAMSVVTVFMISGHLEHPKLPSWEFRLQLKLVRILLARIPIGWASKRDLST